MVISTRPKSYFVCFEPDKDKPLEEYDYMACQHCGTQQRIPRTGLHDVGDICRYCWKFICPTCVKVGTCDPMEKKLAEAEAGNPHVFNPYRLPG